MRILLLSKAMIVGAYQRKAEELARLPGVELTVAVPPRWNEPRVGLMELERQYTVGYRLVVLPLWFSGHYHVHLYPGLRRLVAQVKPDVLHIDEESFNLATFQAMRAGVTLGARCCFYNYANIAWRYPPPFRWFEQYTFRHAAAAIVANEEAATIIRAHGYRGPVHTVWQFGVDPDLFHPAAPPLPPEPFRIGYLGRFVPEKGLLDLVRAMAQLPPVAELVLIGRGDQATAIRAEIARLGLDGRVTVRPAVPSGEVAAAMRELHAFALPSHTTPRWKEQYGRVLVEAMACGVPPVGSTSGEIPNVIGDAGLVFREGDSDDLASKLRQLIEQPALHAELARRGRQRVLDRYTQQAVAQQYYHVYQQMLHPKTTLPD